MLPPRSRKDKTRVDDEVIARRSCREYVPEVVVALVVAVACNAYFLTALLR